MANLKSVQEILGSAHNLFGGINVIHVRSKGPNIVDKASNSKAKGQYVLERIVWGQMVVQAKLTCV